MLNARGGGGGGGLPFGGYGDVPPVRVYFFANFSCLCSLTYAFQLHSKLCVPSGSGSGSPGDTTPPILVPTPPPPPGCLTLA